MTTSTIHPAGCVLVVDDQEANVQVVGSVLGKLGLEIMPAIDGPQALKRLGLRPVDLILLDVLMPAMDGFEVCRQIQENPAWADIPIIFLSAADEKNIIVRAFESGGVDYITKPFNHAELISRVRTHLALKAARDRLKHLAEDKDELLGILAHDLKNHLGGIHMSAQILIKHAQAFPDRKLVQIAENILNSSSTTLYFVKEFLANAAADYGAALKPKPTRLSEIAARVVKQHQETAARKELTLQKDIAPPEQTDILVDPAALEQVLDNLLSNAIKFSPLGKTITVAVQPDTQSISCSVQDQGPGFTEEDRARMYHRYRRLSARPTGGEPSTGLGLSIVKKLVDSMGGELGCESAPGQGATFTLKLPRATTL